jgi:hypothetical protein
MKRFKTPVLLFLLALGACQKSDDTSTDVTVTEAANMVATSLSTNSGGLILATADITLNAQTIFDTGLACGASKGYSYTHTSATGATPTYSNVFAYTYTMNCNTSNQPDNITGTATDKGTFDGPNLSATNDGNVTFRIAGLTQTATVYAINGEYKRLGTFTSKVESKNTGTITVDLVVTNLLINKSSKIITGGTATVTVTGSTAKKANINFTGTATFTGDGKATVTLAGTAYIVDLLTGVVTKK